MTTVLPPVREALAALDACALDAALPPVEAVAARFAARDLCEAAFVVAMCMACGPGAAGAWRRVAPAVPDFMQAMTILTAADLVAALGDAGLA